MVIFKKLYFYKMKPRIIQGLHTLFNKSGISNLNPEFFHHQAIKVSEHSENIKKRIDFISNTTKVEWEEKLKINLWWLELKNPIGLAAWFVKNAEWVKFWESFWFGYITIWWITQRPQEWNHKKRLFKFKNWKIIVNGMWLNSKWVDYVAKQLQERQAKNMMPEIPLFANICNSRITPDNEKINELKYIMEKLYPYVQAFEINISCPNQKWVFSVSNQLQNTIEELTEFNNILAHRTGLPKRKIFVKIAPLSYNEISGQWEILDGTIEKLYEMAGIVNQSEVDGFVATNTKQEQPYNTKIRTASWNIIWWWASGEILQNISLKTVQELRKILHKDKHIIWVWGIGYDKKWHEWQSALNMIDAWARSLQIYSSFIYNVMTPYNIKKRL